MQFLFCSLVLCGCSDEAARNRNADIAENYNAGRKTDVAATSNSVIKDEKVLRFDDAYEALKKGNIYLETNNIKNAIEVLKQSTKLDPDLAEAHFSLGIAYSLFERDNQSDLEKELSDSKKKNSEKSFENSVKAYKKVISKNPKKHKAHYNLGRAYNKLYDDRKAERALQKAVKLNPDDSIYRTELGAALIKLARYASAIRQLNKAIELDKENFRAEDLLVKAKAGRKRIGFKPKPKIQSTPTPVKGSVVENPETVEKTIPKEK